MINRQRLAQLQRQSVRAQPLTMPTIVPPPIKGWNTRDALDAMDPQDAIEIENFQPGYGGLALREGSEVYNDAGGTDAVTTLAIWRSGASQQMVAARGDTVYLPSEPGTPVLGTGFASPWWQTVAFQQRLYMVNGQDPPQVYDGTTLAAANFTPTAGLPPGVSPAPTPPPAGPLTSISQFVGVQVFHNRLFFWTGDQAGFWYADLYAVQGAVYWFPFDMSVESGAYLVAAETLTYDGGQGISSYQVFILSTGEMLTYQGTNPADPSNWSLVGLYTISPPLSPRAICRYGGDAYIVTSSDYAKLSQLLIALKLGAMPPLSKATGACEAAVLAGRGLAGWQVVYWGRGRRLIVNVPLPAPDPAANNSPFEQHVYHTGLDAWTRYRGLPASCWCVWGDDLYFGAANGVVCRFGILGGDEVGGAAVAPITAFVQQAWALFGTPQYKRCAAVRPVVRSGAAASWQFGFAFDYADPELNITVDQAGLPVPWSDQTPTPAQPTPWGVEYSRPAMPNPPPPYPAQPIPAVTALAGVLWERPAETEIVWYLAEGEGSAISVAMQITTNTAELFTWLRTDLRLEQGSAL